MEHGSETIGQKFISDHLPTCNPVDKAFDAYKRLGGLSDGAASVAAELGDRGMRTKSWTPLLILTKSEPVLYRAQSS